MAVESDRLQQIKVAGAYKDSSEIHARVGGAWKPVAATFTKVAGVWKRTYWRPCGCIGATHVGAYTQVSTSYGFNRYLSGDAPFNQTEPLNRELLLQYILADDPRSGAPLRVQFAGDGSVNENPSDWPAELTVTIAGVTGTLVRGVQGPDPRVNYAVSPVGAPDFYSVLQAAHLAGDMVDVDITIAPVLGDGTPI